VDDVEGDGEAADLATKKMRPAGRREVDKPAALRAGHPARFAWSNST